MLNEGSMSLFSEMILVVEHGVKSVRHLLNGWKMKKVHYNREKINGVTVENLVEKYS